MAKLLEGLPPDRESRTKKGMDRRWRMARVFAYLAAGEQSQGVALDLDRERARLAKAQADKTEMQNAIQRGELLRADLIGDDLERALGVFRERMRSAPSKLAPRVNPEKPALAQALIAEEHDRILAELAKAFAEIIAEPVGEVTAEGDAR